MPQAAQKQDQEVEEKETDEVEVEVEMETIPEAEEEGYRDGIDDEKEDVREDLDFDKVRDALNQGFPDLGEDTIDAIATLVSSLYNDEVVVEAEDVDVEVKEEEELSKVCSEAFEAISKRLDALEDAPASKGVTHSPNKLSAQHKSVDLSKLNSVDRALHIINSHR